MCFINLTKAFDHIRQKLILTILTKNNTLHEIRRRIKQLNRNKWTRIRLKNKLTQEVNVSTGIRQGDLLSTLLFNIVLDRIIDGTKQVNRGYQLGQNKFQTICYADNAVMIAENEDEQYRLLYNFYQLALKFNMHISIEKSKSMVNSK